MYMKSEKEGSSKLLIRRPTIKLCRECYDDYLNGGIVFPDKNLKIIQVDLIDDCYFTKNVQDERIKKLKHHKQKKDNYVIKFEASLDTKDFASNDKHFDDETPEEEKISVLIDWLIEIIQTANSENGLEDYITVYKNGKIIEDWRAKR